MAENKILGGSLTDQLAESVNRVKNQYEKLKEILRKRNVKGDARPATDPALRHVTSYLPSRVYPLRIPLPPADEKGWKPYPIFKDKTSGLDSLSCHVSVLNQECCPHYPHTHEEEEIMMVLSGEIDTILPDLKGNNRRRVTAGQFVYYPAHFSHTLKTTGEAPANYLMFNRESASTNTGPVFPYGQFDILDPVAASEGNNGFSPRLLFEGMTRHLQKLQCHSSTLDPGAGYDPHIDPYDVAIIVLEGEVETLGERVVPHSVIYYAAGEPHGMSNPGQKKAKYIVFEFHGRC